MERIDLFGVGLALLAMVQPSLWPVLPKMIARLGLTFACFLLAIAVLPQSPLRSHALPQRTSSWPSVADAGGGSFRDQVLIQGFVDQVYHSEGVISVMLFAEEKRSQIILKFRLETDGDLLKLRRGEPISAACIEGRRQSKLIATYDWCTQTWASYAD